VRDWRHLTTLPTRNKSRAHGSARLGPRLVWTRAQEALSLRLTGPAVSSCLVLCPRVYGVWLSFTNWQFLQSTTAHFEGLGRTAHIP